MQMIPFEQEQSITMPAPPDRPVWSLDLAIQLWLDAKFKRSSSERTRQAYKSTLKEFRSALQSIGLDLDSVASQDDKVAMQVTRDQVKQLAQVFSGFSKKEGRQVKESTINHRLSVLSSFYAFCMRQEWLDYNPIDHLGERSKVESFAGVQSLDFDEVTATFDRLDMNKLEDVRDSALLAILLETGHRATVVARLQWQHVTVKKFIVTLFFDHCKGNKSAHVELSKKTSSAVLRWLHRFYGRDLARMAKETPLFVSLARGCDPRNHEPSYGHALSIQAIGQICLNRLGTSKVHAMRHTFTMGMLASGASPQEVQKKLLHSSLHTTTLYVDHLTEAKNAHASDLADLFGIK